MNANGNPTRQRGSTDIDPMPASLTRRVTMKAASLTRRVTMKPASLTRRGTRGNG
ncbi:hypothetical protein CA85_01790 [Allorhodopirellula solitaria]|uniref:Uncharacterized protein n=1 Tax=Allorhodopirellula solitaria TaxID=2527987 RepID=A0A5C5YJ49_9BACT|nr:hypothetical protein CA85_01790 [Allorhodopirellula solitaria]